MSKQKKERKKESVWREMRRVEIKGADERKEQNDAEDVQENNQGGARKRQRTGSGDDIKKSGGKWLQ